MNDDNNERTHIFKYAWELNPLELSIGGFTRVEYLKRRNFCKMKFLWNLFLRIGGPRKILLNIHLRMGNRQLYYS